MELGWGGGLSWTGGRRQTCPRPLGVVDTSEGHQAPPGVCLRLSSLRVKPRTDGVTSVPIKTITRSDPFTLYSSGFFACLVHLVCFRQRSKVVTKRPRPT